MSVKSVRVVGGGAEGEEGGKNPQAYSVLSMKLDSGFQAPTLRSHSSQNQKSAKTTKPHCVPWNTIF